MKTVILSPHTDDAIFSLGDWMQSQKQVAILTIFAGIPNDSVGFEKHSILRKEHERACETMGVQYANADFLDDVYQPRPDDQEIVSWLERYIRPTDQIVCPLGIKHPDHIQLRRVVQKFFPIDRYYAELPYMVNYPDMVHDLRESLDIKESLRLLKTTDLKRKAVECYVSQLKSDDIRSRIFVPEEIYG